MAQHEDIYTALTDHDTELAEAASLVHVANTESWVRRIIGDDRE